jgi:hypothetical protein
MRRYMNFLRQDYFCKKILIPGKNQNYLDIREWRQDVRAVPDVFGCHKKKIKKVFWIYKKSKSFRHKRVWLRGAVRNGEKNGIR